MSATAVYRFAGGISGGSSKTAEFIAERIRQPRQQLQNSYVLGQQAKGSINDLQQIFYECRYENWDGYDALPVFAHTFRSAYEFLETLPLGTSAPSIGAEPDGHITLEWYNSPRRIVSISISPDGDLHYAALIGASKAYGTEPFIGEIPKEVMGLINRVTSA